VADRKKGGVSQRRAQAGTPVGGQFVAVVRQEADVAQANLDAAAPQSRIGLAQPNHPQAGGAWRVTASFDDPAPAKRTARELSGREIETQVRRLLDARAVASVTERNLYLCTGTRESADAAKEIIRAVLARHQLRASLTTLFWETVVGCWASPDGSAPDDTAITPAPGKHRYGSHGEIARDTRIADASGLATWEVRVDLESHHHATIFAQRLKADGHPPVRHWRHLLVGARNQDEAHDLCPNDHGAVQRHRGVEGARSS
jgi:hypothetical protein